MKSLQELNPLVKVSYKVGHVAQQNEKFFDDFDLVLLTNCSLKEYIQINEICRKKKILFFAADSFGQFSIMFQDLLDFEYQIKDAKNKVDVKKSVKYVSLKKIHTEANWGNIKRLSKIWLGIQLLYHYRDTFGNYPTPAEEKKLSELSEKFLTSKKLSPKSIPDELIKYESIYDYD